MEELQLRTNKIVNIDYLINKVGFKEEQFNTPLFSFLIGAGCSITSKIPSGNRVMTLCSHLAFLNQHKEGNPFLLEDFNSFLDYINAIDNYINKELIELYTLYKNQKESEFYKMITKEEIIKKIPSPMFESEFKRNNNAEIVDLNYESFFKKIHLDNLYGKWFEIFSEDPRDRQKLIENIIDCQEISGEYIILSYLIKQGLIHNIFTTNFDDILNESLSIYSNTKARVFSHNETARYISIGSKKPNIIKLHGDYLFENIKNTIEETSELENNMSFKLNEALLHLGLIVIGYNGSDYSIMNSLSNIKSERPFPLIWCTRNINNLHWRVIHLINNTPNSYVVEVDDFTTLMVRLWTRYGSGNFDLRVDAEQRQLKVTEALEQTKNKINLSESINNIDKKIFNDSIDIVSIVKEAESTMDISERVDLLKKAVNLDANNTEILNLLGRSLLLLSEDKTDDFSANNLKQAKDVLTKAINIDPKYHQAYGNLGNVLREMSDKSKGAESENLLLEAKYQYEKVIELDPNSYKAYGNIGRIYSDLGRKKKGIEASDLFSKAILNYEKALSFNPNSSVAYNNIGNVNFYIALNKKGLEAENLYYRSIDLYKKALLLTPNYASYYNNIASAFMKVSSFKKDTEAENLLIEAKNSYEKAIELDPNFVKSYINLSSVLDMLARTKGSPEAETYLLEAKKNKDKAQELNAH